MPKNAKKINKNPYLKKQFDFYVAWKSIPFVFIGKPIDVLKRFGFEDEMYIDLAGIKTQSEFAQRFGIKDLGTLTDWNKKIEEGGLIKNKVHDWARNMSKDVNFSFTQKTIQNPTAARVKLWHQLFMGWRPSSSKFGKMSKDELINYAKFKLQEENMKKLVKLANANYKKRLKEAKKQGVI